MKAVAAFVHKNITTQSMQLISITCTWAWQ